MKPEEVLNEYGIGEVKEISPISVGLIHQTFKVKTSMGVFILQKLHNVYSAKAVVQNIFSTSEYLHSNGMIAQRVVPTMNADLLYEKNDESWRLLTYISGKVYETVPNPEVAFEAGKILGSFHRVLFQAPLHFIAQRSAGSPDYIQRFQKTLIENKIPENMKSFAETIKKIFDFTVPENLQKGIVQGDPKITNIIFDETGEHAKVLIDIDDVGEAPLLNDLTDATRSWCSDREDSSANVFSIEKFEAMLRGYKEGSQNLLVKDDALVLPLVTQKLVLTLASRFFVDWFEDSYFGFDTTRYRTRKEHNLARIQGQIALYRNLVNKEEEMLRIVKLLFGSVD